MARGAARPRRRDIAPIGFEGGVILNPPVNSVAPVASGFLTVGSVLSVTTGTWTNSPTSYVYQWKRNGSTNVGTNANTYTLVTADIGATMTCGVIAVNADGSNVATSNALGPVVEAGFTAVAVNFDGTNDWLTRAAVLTGLADGKTGTVSLWFNKLGGDGATAQLMTTTTPRFAVRFFSTVNTLEVIGYNTAGTIIMQLRTTGTHLSGAGWKHFLASWDLANNLALIYINDVVAALGTNTKTNDTIDYTNLDFAVGATVTGTQKYNGDLSEVFLHSSFLDISVEANRRLFISATGKPVSLGANGSTPFGTQPSLYLGNPLASWHTNLGAGGGFNVTGGALTAASTSPSG